MSVCDLAALIPTPVTAERLRALIDALEDGVDVVLDVDLDTGTIMLLTTGDGPALVGDVSSRDGLAAMLGTLGAKLDDPDPPPPPPVESITGCSTGVVPEPADEPATPVEEVPHPEVTCSSCGQVCASANGLAVHRARKHRRAPVDHDAARRRAAESL